MLTGCSREAHGVKSRCGVGDEGNTRERIKARHEPALYPGVSAMVLKQKVSPTRASPGYMMTKLTRTILSNNPELKVWRCFFIVYFCRLTQPVRGHGKV